jgi:hypothetical protein
MVLHDRRCVPVDHFSYEANKVLCLTCANACSLSQSGPWGSLSGGNVVMNVSKVDACLQRCAVILNDCWSLVSVPS